MSIAASVANVDTPRVPILKVMLMTILTATVPTIAKWCKNNIINYSQLHRIGWVIPFLTNFITVSLPGRFDSQQEKAGDVFKLLRTLFEPAPWAFAIWGVIYIGELLLTGYVGIIGQQESVIKKAMPAWLAGNLFQSLWCLTFRPQFGGVLWLPMSLLTFGAISFGFSHHHFSRAIAELPSMLSWDGLTLSLMRFPLALHTGWLAAASLLNFNTWIAVSFRTMDTQIAIAFLSIYAAAVVGLVVTASSKDPFIAFTIAWALAALADRTQKKQFSPKDSPDRLVEVDTLGALAKTEKTLSYSMIAVGVGAVISQNFPFKSMF